MTAPEPVHRPQRDTGQSSQTILPYLIGEPDSHDPGLDLERRPGRAPPQARGPVTQTSLAQLAGPFDQTMSPPPRNALHLNSISTSSALDKNTIDHQRPPMKSQTGLQGATRGPTAFRRDPRQPTPTKVPPPNQQPARPNSRPITPNNFRPHLRP